MKTLPPEKQERLAVSLGFALLTNQLAYWLGRLLGQGRSHADMACPLDAYIPFLPWTVILYLSFFLFWFLMSCYFALRREAEGDRYFCALLLVNIGCFLFYVLLPTSTLRPEITGGSVWDAILGSLYRMDAPDNLFPSMHCAVSWLCWVPVRGKRDVPATLQIFSFFTAAVICISTMTTKQHILVDVVGGIFFAELGYWVSGTERVSKLYHLAIGSILRNTSQKSRKNQKGLRSDDTTGC